MDDDNGGSSPAPGITVPRAALDQSELILRSIREAVIMTNLDGIVTYWNEGATHMFGWSAEEMLGRPYADRFPPEHRAWLLKEIQQRAAGVEWDGDFEDMRKDGTRIWIRSLVRKITDPDGRPAGILGVSHDITEQKRAEQARRANEEMARSVLDSMSAHIAVLDADGRITAVNRAWRRFAADNAPPGQEIARGTDVGTSYLEVCRRPSGRANAVGLGIEDVLGGRVACFEQEYPCHSPTEKRWFRMSVTPLGHEAGGAVVAHTDITHRVRSEEAMRRQSEQLRLALSAARMGVWAVSFADDSITWSPEVKEVLQMREPIRSRHEFLAMVHPDDRAKMEAKYQRAISDHGPFDGQFRFVRPDGAVRWLHNFGQIQHGPDGAPASLVGTVQDITETKLAEAALVRQNRVLEQVAGGAPLGQILEEITALVEEQLPGTTCSILVRDRTADVLRLGAGPNLPPEYKLLIDNIPIGPGSGPCGRAAYHRRAVLVPDFAKDPARADFGDIVLQYGFRSCLSLPIVYGAPDGEGGHRVLGTFAVHRREIEEPGGPLTEIAAAGVEPGLSAARGTSLGGPLHDPANSGAQAPLVHKVIASALHLAGLAIARQGALQDLQESEERFRLLVEGVKDYAMFLLDPDGRVLTWSSGAERTFGYSAAEALGSTIERFCSHDEAGKKTVADRIAELPAEGRLELDGWWIREDGTRFWGMTVATALRLPDGSIRGFAVVIRDLTERRRLEEQLHQSQKMEAIGQLAGGVAHDFNNLLMIINGYSDMLLDDMECRSPLAAAVQEIREAGERAASLTTQLLAFSRKAIVKPRLLDLNAVVDAAGKMLQRLIGEDIQLTFRLAPGLGPVKLDPGQLDQVLMNLAVNARDAMPTGGRLLVETTSVSIPETTRDDLGEIRAGRYAQLSMTDTGAGIPDEVRAHIFEPFFTTKGPGKGTGLGLATVYGVVQQAGGGIQVQSEVGAGTTFRLLFPIAGESAAAAVSSREVLPRGAETLLIVEDEEAVRRIVQKALESYGYRVLAAASGRAATEIAAAHGGEIHLLIADVVMPDQGGRALAESLRSGRPSLRVLYMSGHTDDAVVRYGVETARAAFLQKPFTPQVLARKVREVLDAPR